MTGVLVECTSAWRPPYEVLAGLERTREVLRERPEDQDPRRQAVIAERRLRAGRPPFRFIDGPITANNPMGVHHGWGRTYKDLFQRFWAMRASYSWRRVRPNAVGRQTRPSRSSVPSGARTVSESSSSRRTPTEVTVSSQ